jgi:uncharacterized protein (TIGR02246 family)
MSERIFPTAQDAENAFYEALERADLEAMMGVWAEDEEIVCVHPSGQRITGAENVRESWRQIFAGGPNLRVHITQRVAIAGMMVVVHNLHENITVAGEPRARPPVVVTNVYLRTASGWRMILHHGSPAAGAPADAPPPPPPKILH